MGFYELSWNLGNALYVFIGSPTSEMLEIQLGSFFITMVSGAA